MKSNQLNHYARLPKTQLSRSALNFLGFSPLIIDALLRAGDDSRMAIL
jgi:hypothetical protein